jgi:hypothetical protein
MKANERWEYAKPTSTPWDPTAWRWALRLLLQRFLYHIDNEIAQIDIGLSDLSIDGGLVGDIA